jgi:hypothetical protein
MRVFNDLMATAATAAGTAAFEPPHNDFNGLAGMILNRRRNDLTAAETAAGAAEALNALLMVTPPLV